MATNILRGTAPLVAQVNTETPANIEVGDVFKITLADDLGNSHEIFYTAAATTAKDVVEGLKAAAVAAKAADIAPWNDVTASEDDSVLTLTADTPGKPFIATTSTTNGGANNTQTLTNANTTANSGPEDFAVAANWSLGAVPVNTNEVIIPATLATGILYGLDQSGVALASLTVERGYSGAIASAGAPLQIAATNVHFAGSGMAFIKANGVTGAFNVTHCGTAATAGLPPLNVTGATIASFNFSPEDSSCRAAIAGLAGETATVTTLRQSGGDLTVGSGTTLATVNRTGGSLTTHCGFSTLAASGPGTHVHDAGAIAAAAVFDGTLDYRSTGTLAALIVAGDGVFTLDNDPRAKTITAADAYRGATIRDGHKIGTWTSGIDLNQCSLADVTIDLGDNLRVTPGAVS